METTVLRSIASMLCLLFLVMIPKPVLSAAPEKTSLETVTDVRLTVLFDNMPFDERLETGWGFSCLVECPDTTILFDTGADGSILMGNMEKLSIDPAVVDCVVLSHIHGDHVDGLKSFLSRNGEVDVYVPVSFPDDFKKKAEEYGCSIVDVSAPRRICRGVYSTGEIGTDIIEQSLVLRTAKGTIVITGCAHPGIAGIVEKAAGLYGKPVLLVMGGFHLGQTSEKDVRNIITRLRKAGMVHGAPTHCTGEAAISTFRKELGDDFVNVGVGGVISIEDIE